MTSSLFVAGLVIAIVVVTSRALSVRAGVPYPVFLVVTGAAVSFVPHMPALTLQPQVVFLGFLPPLVYHAGLVTSPRELRANALPIGLGALGLVLATTFAVAGATWMAAPRLGWAAAFVLGAVLAPTDPVAATSVLNRLGGPPSVTTILEGESLVNDGVALALFSLGTAALVAPTGMLDGFVSFVKIAGGGTAFGLALGWVAGHLRQPLRDTSSQVVVSLVVPYVAYLPADALGLSGVLATLATGLVLGQKSVAGLGPAGRLRVAEFWEVLVFLLESVLFILVGLQLRHLVGTMGNYPPADIALVAGLATAAVIVVRMLWWAALPNLRWKPEGKLIDTGAVPWPERLVLGWSGLRGAISLAAALSVPTMVAGHRFSARPLIVFATFCTLVVTLVGQGTTLPWLLRRLKLVGGGAATRQHALANRRCAEAALRRLDELVSQEEVSDKVAEALRRLYERRIDRARLQVGDTGSDQDGADDEPSWDTVQRRLLRAQYEVLRRMHRQGEISFSVLRAVRRELDLEHSSLGR